MNLPSFLMNKLGFWWSEKIEEQGILEHNHNSMKLLQAPLRKTYEDVLGYFAGSWESTRQDFCRLPNQETNFNWPELDLARLNIEHINNTGFMLLDAIIKGDQAAAEWMADIFSKWWQDMYGEEPYPLLNEKSDFITIESLDRNWTDIQNDFDFKDNNQSKLPMYFFRIAIKNYWQDIRLLIIEILLFLSVGDGEHTQDNSLSLHIACGLLRGDEWRSGGCIEYPLLKFSAQEYLTAKVRQYITSDGEVRYGYIKHLDSFLDNIWGLLQPKMIIGRIYSCKIENNIDKLRNAQFILFLLLSNSNCNLDRKLLSKLKNLLSNGLQNANLLNNWANAMKNYLDELGTNFDFYSIDKLFQKTNNTQTQQESYTRTNELINQLVRELSEARNDIIVKTPISQDRISKIEETSSINGFSASTGKFPIQLFKKISFNENSLQFKHTLNISKINKDEVIDTNNVSDHTNTYEHYSEAIKDFLGQTLIQDVLKKCKVVNTFKARDANTYWEILKKEAHQLAKQGLTPILILNNPTQPPWIFDWQHPHPYAEKNNIRPSDLFIKRDENRGDSYIADFNNIQVFFSPFADQSTLMARETFVNLVFKKYEGDHLIRATATQRKDIQTLIDLTLSYEYNIELNHLNVVRIRYS